MATALLPAFPPTNPSSPSSSLPASRLTIRRRVTSADFILAYVVHGRLDAALTALARSSRGNAFLYNQAVRGCADAGLHGEAIAIYHAMFAAGVAADRFTFPVVAKSCGALWAYDEGRAAHCRAFKLGLHSDLYVGNAFIAMYAKCGSIGDAESMFDEMAYRDRVSWNSMIDGYVANGDAMMALRFFAALYEALGVRQDRYGIMSALAACSMEMALSQGKQIHCYVIRHSFEFDVKVQTSLIDMYCKCGDVLYAEKAFAEAPMRNVATWNSLIGGFAANSLPEKALACVREMRAQDMEVDAVTMVNVLAACAAAQDALHTKEVHALTLRRGFLPHIVLETALVDAYGKCGDVKAAQALFDMMPEKTVVSWNAIIAAYAQAENCNEAVELFVEMVAKAVQPDIFTLSAVLPAYVELRSLRHSKQIHGFILRTQHGNETLVLNSVIYMYARSGDVETAREVFDRITSKDVISWNTMIMAYAIHGDSKAALELFTQMKGEGIIQPNDSTFVSVLTACSVSGLAEEGWEIFHAMQEEYGIAPQVEHYGCMVDLVGRTNDSKELLEFASRVPFGPTGRIWGSVLTASRNKNDIAMAELAADKVFQLEHDNTGCHVLLTGMYAEAGRWADVERIQNLMAQRGLRRTEPRSTVEVDNTTYSFVNDDSSHTLSRIILEVSEILSRKMGESSRSARVPASRHCVRLAVVFGLISSEVGTPVVVKKNVRICNDCHRAMKFISSYSGRKIVVGDSRIYHHFCRGSCCCNDYW